MKIEIDNATNFLVELMKKSSPSKSSKLSEEQLHRFRLTVVDCLTNHYADHWHPDHPVKGSGYRCIRINGKVDPLLVKAGHLIGLAAQFLRILLPSDLTMWVDPHEVSYRIGENGSICILYEDENIRFRTPPSPPTTPASKRIRCSPEPPATPLKLTSSQQQIQLSQQVTPPQALPYHQLISPSNNQRRSPPTHYHHLMQHHFAFLKESASCKDLMRSNHMLAGPEGLYVSSWDGEEKSSLWAS